MDDAVDIVVVHHRAPDLLDHTLTALSRWPEDSNRRLLLVNNSPEDSLHGLHMGRLQVMQCQANVGISAAMNAALSHLSAPWVLLLSPGCSLGFTHFRRMLRHLHKTPKLGAIGPKLCTPTGRRLTYDCHFPTLWRLRLRTLALHRLSSWSMRTWRRAVDVDWIRANCMLLRREAVDAVGGFDPRFHSFFEEVDLCRRLRDAGWLVRFEPRAAATRHQNPADRFNPVRTANKVRSEMTYFAKYHPRDWLAVYQIIYLRLELRLLYAQLRQATGSSTALRRVKALSAGLQTLRAFSPSAVIGRKITPSLDASDLEPTRHSLHDSSDHMRP